VLDVFSLEMRQRLEAEQATLQDELVRQRALAETEEKSEHAGLGNHMADDASEMYEQEQNLAFQQNTAQLLFQVESALRRMDAGFYGLCESCGQLIDRARLESLPYATLCVTCKARQERV
jgi:DnaK suppressor protein